MNNKDGFYDTVDRTRKRILGERILTEARPLRNLEIDTLHKYLPGDCSIMDAYSGAGTAVLGLMYRYSNRISHLYLVDNDNEQVRILNELVKKLDLDNVEVLEENFEDMCVVDRLPEVDVVTLIEGLSYASVDLVGYNSYDLGSDLHILQHESIPGWAKESLKDIGFSTQKIKLEKVETPVRSYEPEYLIARHPNG